MNTAELIKLIESRLAKSKEGWTAASRAYRREQTDGWREVSNSHMWFCCAYEKLLKDLRREHA
jgi:hypothetical protein